MAKASAQVALAALTKAATNDRLAVLQAIMGTSGLSAVIGDVTFDANGDAKGGVISSYQVGTAWPPVYKGVITASEVRSVRLRERIARGGPHGPPRDAIWPIRASVPRPI